MNDDRLLELIDAMLEERLAESERAELARMLVTSAAAREIYWELVQQEVLLQDVVQEASGRDLAQMSLGKPAADHVLLGEDQVLLGEDHLRRGRGSGRGVGASGRGIGDSGWGVGALGRGAGGKRSGLLRGLLAALGVVLAVAVYAQLSGPAALPNRGPAMATLQSLTGDVWLVASGSDTVKAASGQQFTAGDAVRVGEGGGADVTLADGSRVMLSADSLLRFASADASRKRLHLEMGAAEVEAASQSPDRPLIITTGQARLTVLGTRFRLYAAGDNSRVELEEGKVRFERQSDGQAVEVAAGQYAVATMDQEAPQPLLAHSLDTQWRLRQTLLRAGSRVVFSHDGALLATASFPRLKVWNVATGELRHELNVGFRLECLAFTPSDQAIVGLDNYGHAIFWPLDQPDARRTELPAERGNLRRCAVSRDGRWLAQTTSDNSGHLPVWRLDDTGTISPLRSLPMKASGLAIAATATGPQVVSSVWHGTTVKWEADTGRELARYEFRLQLHVLDLFADGRQFAGYGNQTGLLLVDTESGLQRNLWPAGSVHVNCLRFSRDGRVLFAGMADGIVRAWSTADGQPLLVLATGDSQLSSLDISNDGRWLAASGSEGRVTLWQLDQEGPH